MKTQEAASRIIRALYGRDYVYRAPETYEPGHRWGHVKGTDSTDQCERCHEYIGK